MPGKGGLQLTGKLGEVIRESAQIGLSWVKSHAYELGITTSPTDQFLNDIDVHVHMPEGSIGKEGPSAGTAILTAFVSLFTKTRVSPDIGKASLWLFVDMLIPDDLSYDWGGLSRWTGAPCRRSQGEDIGRASCGH